MATGTTWTEIPDSDLDQDSPITVTLMTALRDNANSVAAEETEPGHRVSYVCEDTTLFGKITAIVADGTSDYQGDGSDPFTAAFIGDASGLLSDGSNSARTA